MQLVASRRPAVEMVRSERNKELCAHLAVCLCLLIDTHTITYVLQPYRGKTKPLNIHTTNLKSFLGASFVTILLQHNNN